MMMAGMGNDAEVVCRELGLLQDGIGVLIFTQSVYLRVSTCNKSHEQLIYVNGKE